MKHIYSITSGVALGSAGVVMMSILSGCESSQQEQKQQQNKFLVIEQQADGKYTVVEEMPTEGPSRAIIREIDANGNKTERIMSEAEMKALAEQEYKKVQDGTSETLSSSEGSAGMGLAGTILAVAAGSLLGNMIGNALMNNKNFSQRASAANQSAYNRPASGTPNAASSSKKSYFGGSTPASTPSSSSSSSTTNGG
jgi:hypothetical protein